MGVCRINRVHQVRCRTHHDMCMSVASCSISQKSCRRGRRPSSQDEELGPLKESPPVMQPLGVSQIELHLQSHNSKDVVPDTSIAGSGFVRCCAIIVPAVIFFALLYVKLPWFLMQVSSVGSSSSCRMQANTESSVSSCYCLCMHDQCMHTLRLAICPALLMQTVLVASCHLHLMRCFCICHGIRQQRLAVCSASFTTAAECTDEQYRSLRT